MSFFKAVFPLAKVSAITTSPATATITIVLALATLGNVTQIGSKVFYTLYTLDRIISIDQGKYIRRNIAGIIVRDIALNFANENDSGVYTTA
jgi:hypothetical protein